MSDTAMSSRRLLVAALAVLLLVAIAWAAWAWQPPAPPGQQPAAPPAPGQAGRTNAGQPTDGIPARLSDANARAVKSGKEVKIAMPGGGHITFGPPKKDKQKSGRADP